MSNTLRYTIEYILLILLGVGIIFICLRSCNGKSADVQRIEDSIRTEKILNDTIQNIGLRHSQHVDTINAHHTRDSLKFSRKIDSFAKVCASLKSNFLATRDTITSLHNRLEAAFLSNDSNAVWLIADSLNSELVKANNQLFAWQVGRDSVEIDQLKEIQRLRDVITQLQGEVSTFKILLAECTNNASNLAKNGNAIIAKLKKRTLWAKISGTLNIILAALLFIK